MTSVASPVVAHHGSLQLVVMVRPEDALGFKLAGAKVEPVEAGEEVMVWRRVVSDPMSGVMAIDEQVLAAVPERLVKRVHERGLPVVLPFALPRRWSEEGRGRAYVAAIIRRAVGYAVKLGGAGGDV